MNFYDENLILGDGKIFVSIRIKDFSHLSGDEGRFISGRHKAQTLYESLWDVNPDLDFKTSTFETWKEVAKLIDQKVLSKRMQEDMEIDS
ncbi:hypothetical protein M5689_011247 [Euphorbia peplus]|nr:hypothetical protein M5689_011247 [Euphorbia peplus]